MVIAKIRTAKQQYYQNVALKVNVKLAGVNQVIKSGVSPMISKEPTIIFGAE
jgi:eukaryotic translation initiation factor 2C